MNQITLDNHTFKLRIHHQPDKDTGSETQKQIVTLMNETLVMESVLSQKTRITDWNIRRAGFSNFHVLLNVHFNKLNEISQHVAARIRRMAGLAESSYEELQKSPRLKEATDFASQILDLKADHEKLIHFLHESATKCSEEFEDEISRGFLMDIIHMHEKMAAQLSLYLENKSSRDISSIGGNTHD